MIDNEYFDSANSIIEDFNKFASLHFTLPNACRAAQLNYVNVSKWLPKATKPNSIAYVQKKDFDIQHLVKIVGYIILLVRYQHYCLVDKHGHEITDASIIARNGVIPAFTYRKAAEPAAISKSKNYEAFSVLFRDKKIAPFNFQLDITEPLAKTDGHIVFELTEANMVPEHIIHSVLVCNNDLNTAQIHAGICLPSGEFKPVVLIRDSVVFQNIS